MSTRDITTTYYYGHQVMKVNRSNRPYQAFLNCILHLQKNDYCARIAEIVDGNGILIAVITRNINGLIKIRYQHKSICTVFTLPDGSQPATENTGMNNTIIAKITAEQAWLRGAVH